MRSTRTKCPNELCIANLEFVTWLLKMLRKISSRVSSSPWTRKPRDCWRRWLHRTCPRTPISNVWSPWSSDHHPNHHAQNFSSVKHPVDWNPSLLMKAQDLIVAKKDQSRRKWNKLSPRSNQLSRLSTHWMLTSLSINSTKKNRSLPTAARKTTKIESRCGKPSLSTPALAN